MKHKVVVCFAFLALKEYKHNICLLVPEEQTNRGRKVLAMYWMHA